MIFAQMTKVVNLTPPAAIVDNASLTVAELDTKGFDYAEIYLIMGATDIALSACILTESDTAGSGHANIAASNFDGQTESDGTTAALPSATDDDGVFKWELNLTKRKRYLDATITVGDGTSGGYYAVIAVLSRAKETPSSISNRGLAGCIRI
jgi:hypothetical protein